MLEIFIVSDSTGETANAVANSILIQFPEISFSRKLFSNMDTKIKVDQMFNSAKDNTFIIMTVVNREVSQRISKLAQERGIKVVDILNHPITMIEELTGKTALKKSGLMRDTDNEYFNKMD